MSSLKIDVMQCYCSNMKLNCFFIEIKMKLHLSTLGDYLRFMHGINMLIEIIRLEVKQVPVLLMLTKKKMYMKELK